MQESSLSLHNGGLKSDAMALSPLITMCGCLAPLSMTKITINENLNNISEITKITIIVYFLSLTVCLDEREEKETERRG